MKSSLITIFTFLIILSSNGQIIEGDFKVVKIDSLNYYYLIYVKDSLNNEKLVLSLKEPSDTLKCTNGLEMIKLGETYHLKLHHQLYICANRKKNIYIDLLEMDYYDNGKFIAGKYKIPYYTPNFYKLFYCAVVDQEKKESNKLFLMR